MWPRYSDNKMYTNFGSAGWQIRNNGNGDVIFLKDNGDVGIGTTNPLTKLQVNGTADASLTAHGVLMFGSATNANVILDQNEIMARNNGANSTLYIRNYGGITSFG
jgi:hypothetical protein